MGSIDTIFGEGKKTADETINEIKKFAVRLSISQEVKSKKFTESAAANYVKKTFDFPNFPRYAYCVLSQIEVQLTQTGLGSGFGYLKFTQDCNSRRGDDVSYPDWDFMVELRDNGGAFIRNVYLGAWDHRCGKQFVELQENFNWVAGSINPIDYAVTAKLTWTFKQEVSPCG